MSGEAKEHEMEEAGPSVRIAVPTEGDGGLDAPRSMHFGHAASFTIIDLAGNTVERVSTLANGPHEHGACVSIVARLAEAGVAVVIAGGMGGGPRAGFASAGIPVFFDAESPTPADAVAAYLAGTSETFGDVHQCRGH